MVLSNRFDFSRTSKIIGKILSCGKCSSGNTISVGRHCATEVTSELWVEIDDSTTCPSKFGMIRSIRMHQVSFRESRSITRQMIFSSTLLLSDFGSLLCYILALPQQGSNSHIPTSHEHSVSWLYGQSIEFLTSFRYYCSIVLLIVFRLQLYSLSDDSPPQNKSSDTYPSVIKSQISNLCKNISFTSYAGLKGISLSISMKRHTNLEFGNSNIICDQQ